MESNKLCAVLVNSCDRYSEAWKLFFSLFFMAWEDCPFQVYLSTERKHFDHNRVITINTGDGPWTRRLHRALEMIDNEFVLVFLEDFFLQAPVNKQEINNKLKCMENDEKLACFYFNRITGYQKKSTKFPGYFEMIPENSSRYMMNCQAALWNKSVLFQATNQDFSPWEFEEYGFEELPNDVKEKSFFCSANTYYDAIREGDVFSYILVREQGYGIWNSKWLWNNKKLFKKCGLMYEPKELGELKWIDYQKMRLWNKFKLGKKK